MAPRPYWKGYLKLSLVSCAVALFPATSRSERISFHWLNRESGNRLRQLMVDSDTNDAGGARRSGARLSGREKRLPHDRG